MIREAINELKKYTSGKKNTEKVEINVLQLNRVIKALEQEPVLGKIRNEIQSLRNCSCSCSDGIIDDVEDILDKYKAESEE